MAEGPSRQARGLAFLLLIAAAGGAHPSLVSSFSQALPDVTVAAPPSASVTQPPGAAATSDIPESERMRPAREALTRVLAQPQFQRSAVSVWAGQLQERLTRWMADLLQRLGARRPGGRGFAKLLAWVVGLGALAAMALWLVRSLVTVSDGKPLGFGPGVSRRRSARSWARAALAAHRDCNAREAARCAYHAAVVQLEDYGAWRSDDSRTPREYLRLLPPTYRYRSGIAEITTRFEQAWYGSAPPSADDSRAMLARLKELGCLAPDQAI